MALFDQPYFNPYTVGSADDLNFMADSIETLAEGVFGGVNNDARPLFRLRRTTDLAITTTTDSASLYPGGAVSRDTRVPWQAIDEDSDTMCSVSSTNYRNGYVEIHTPGLWLFLDQQRYPVSSSGSRACKLMKNGFQVGVNSFASAKSPAQSDGEGVTLQVFSFIDCAYNDKIYVNTWSSVDATLLANSYGGTWFAGVWLGPS